MKDKKQSGQSSTRAHFIKALQIQNNSRLAQQQAILFWFRNIQPNLSTMQARKELSILHPSGRVKELRDKGAKILTTWTKEYDALGTPHRIARYIYLGMEDSNAK